MFAMTLSMTEQNEFRNADRVESLENKDFHLIFIVVEVSTSTLNLARLLEGTVMRTICGNL